MDWYPETIVELKRAIERDLPVFTGPAQSTSWTGEPYVEWTCNGLISHNDAGKVFDRQLFFSERDAVVAFWRYFSRWQAVTGIGISAGENWAIHWRVPLESDEQAGVWLVYGRFLITKHPDACHQPRPSVAA